MPETPRSSPIRFGDFELDVPAYQLRKGGRAVKLERLAMDLLILLVSRTGELVLRGEIVERLWGRDVFVEVDASVNTLVRKVRRALADPVDRPRFIETVSGKGYRFIGALDAAPGPPAAAAAPLAVVHPPVPPAPEPLPLRVPPTGPSAARARPRSGRVVVGAGLLLVAAIVTTWAWVRARPRGEAAPVRVAVLTFENLSGDPEREYFAQGLTDETAASLGHIISSDRVGVLGRMSTRPYKGSGRSAGDIGRELRVEYLVTGAVQADANRLRVSSSLVRVRDQVQLWSQAYTSEPSSLLAMQQGLATAVAQQVRLRVSPERLTGLAHRQTQNADAYDFYLRGRFFWNQLTPPTTKRALEAYARATALDGDYALAWSGIADAFTTGPITADARPSAVRAQAYQAAERAVRAGPMIAEVQTSTASQQFFLKWDWVQSEAGFRRAIQMDPSYAMAHRLLGVVLSHCRRDEEARASMRRARELEPGYVMNHALSAMVELHAGNLDEAVAHAQRALTIDPEFWVAHYHLAQAYEQQGRDDLALAALIAAGRFSNNNSKALSVRGYVLGKLGRRPEAQRILDTFAELATTRYVPPYARALIYAGLGDREAMFEWLDKAVAEQDVHLIFLPVDPKWNRFRADPRFQDVLGRCAFAPAVSRPAQ
jgi:TolB-like protein/DNA-binding winged helix-turn-helix (wHTH) protein/tetratricopeptide (TPR) repeat protein